MPRIEDETVKVEILEGIRLSDRLLTWAFDPADESRNQARMAAMQFFAALGPHFGVEVTHGQAYFRIVVTKNWRSIGTGEPCAGIYLFRADVSEKSTATRAKQLALIALDAALDHTKPGATPKLRLMPICPVPPLISDQMKVECGDRFYHSLSKAES